MSKAAKDVRASASIIARQNKLVARKEEMMREKKRLHSMGRVSAEEARAFIDKYRCSMFEIQGSIQDHKHSSATVATAGGLFERSPCHQEHVRNYSREGVPQPDFLRVVLR